MVTQWHGRLAHVLFGKTWPRRPCHVADSAYNAIVTRDGNNIAHHPLTFRAGRSYWAVLAFILGLAGLLVLVCWYYLLPAMDAARTATTMEKRGPMAYSWLMLAVVLFILFAGLILTFRIGRFFFPRKTAPRTQTKYVDAWAEAG